MQRLTRRTTIMHRIIFTLFAFALLCATASAVEITPKPAKNRAWGEGFYPNVEVTTHEGKTFRFYDDLMKDRKILINFIYANCERVCPLATARMKQVQKLLGDRVGKDIQMYSITLDPENDTPEVLKAYAEKYGIESGSGWHFLTGDPKDMEELRYRLGERSDNKETHTNVVRIGDGKGLWMRLPLEGGDISALVNDIGKNLDPGRWYENRSSVNYAQAPRLAAPEIGESVFRNRCAACHAIGANDRPAIKLQGPNLEGVTARRDRKWLTRFIYAPDKMRATKDPTALALFEQYRGPMPNTGLSWTQAEEVVEFLISRDEALAKAKQATDKKAEATRYATRTFQGEGEEKPLCH